MEAIKVFVRVRPDQIDAPDHCCVATDPESNVVSIGTRPGLGFSFHVDRVFPADASQDDVFAAVLPVLGECLKGFDVTVFAYGMTGSGKTHTISGSCHGPGLLSRAVQHIFGSLQATAEDDQVSMVFLSYIELYNNMLFDLLSSQTLDETNGTHLKLREHPARGVVVSGSSSLRMPVGSAEEVARLISRGDRLRATSSTLMNDRSSRSHAVIILDIKSKSFAGDSGTEVVKTSRVNLVDLAGSERLKLSGAEGSVRDETCHINKALTCLGDVLNALSRHSLDTRSPALRCLGHVPYRDSKLTMLLKSSLGGHAKTIMLATIRSSSVYFQQSLITLRYAARARHIQNVPIRNISNTTGSEADSRMDTKLTEIRQLRLQLSLRDKECERLGGLLEKASTTNNEQNELEGCMMREEFEKRINVLQSKNVEDHLKLKEELKLLIIKKTSVQSLLQSSEAKVSEMMKRHSLFLVQKEKADLTNAELHRKLREGQLLIKSLQEKNAEWKRAYQVALLNQAAVVIENDTDCSVQDKIICEAKCQHLAQELQELRCASEDSLAAVADLHRHVTDVIMPICCSDSPECSAHDFSEDDNFMYHIQGIKNKLLTCERNLKYGVSSSGKFVLRNLDSLEIGESMVITGAACDKTELEKCKYCLQQDSDLIESLESKVNSYRIQEEFYVSDLSISKEENDNLAASLAFERQINNEMNLRIVALNSELSAERNKSDFAQNELLANKKMYDSNLQNLCVNEAEVSKRLRQTCEELSLQNEDLKNKAARDHEEHERLRMQMEELFASVFSMDVVLCRLLHEAQLESLHKANKSFEPESANLRVESDGERCHKDNAVVDIEIYRSNTLKNYVSGAGETESTRQEKRSETAYCSQQQKETDTNTFRDAAFYKGEPLCIEYDGHQSETTNADNVNGCLNLNSCNLMDPGDLAVQVLEEIGLMTSESNSHNLILMETSRKESNMLLMMKLQEFEIINLLSQKTEEIDVLRDNHSALKIQSKEDIMSRDHLCAMLQMRCDSYEEKNKLLETQNSDIQELLAREKQAFQSLKCEMEIILDEERRMSIQLKDDLERCRCEKHRAIQKLKAVLENQIMPEEKTNVSSLEMQPN